MLDELKDDDLIYLIKINPLFLDKLCYFLSLELQLEKERS
jgi:hypothetical protein